MIPFPQGIIVDISDEDPHKIPMWPPMVKGSSSESKLELLLVCDVEPSFCQEWPGDAIQTLCVMSASCHGRSYAPHVALIGTRGKPGVWHWNWEDLTDMLRPLCMQ